MYGIKEEADALSISEMEGPLTARALKVLACTSTAVTANQPKSTLSFELLHCNPACAPVRVGLITRSYHNLIQLRATCRHGDTHFAVKYLHRQKAYHRVISYLPVTNCQFH